MGGCSATGCSSRNEKGKKLHCFPRDPVRREIWERMVGRRSWKAHNRSRLCEGYPENEAIVDSLSLGYMDHFEESQYESRRMDNLRKLKPNAIPTKFHFKKSKTLRQIVDNLTKTLHATPLSERHIEHSYSQSLEKGPTEKEDHGDLFDLDESLGEKLLKPESFELPLQCVFLCPLDDDDITRPRCEMAIQQHLEKAAPQCESEGPVLQDPAGPGVNAGSVDCEVAHLEDMIRKKDERIAMLLKAVANERREKHKLEREKQNLVQNIEKVFNGNQLARLGRKSGRGVKWSSDTMEKARQLRAMCGMKGYMLLRAQNQPLPSLRCLRKMSPRRKKRLGQGAAAAVTVVDCLQATIGADGAYVHVIMQ